MARHKELAPALFGDDMHAREVGERKYNELVVLFDVVKVNLRVARVRRKVIIVKAAHQGMIRVQHMVIVNTGELFFHQMLLNAIMVVKTGLRAPADIENGIHMRFAPFHNGTHFVPVVHFLKRHLFHRRARDDEAVKALVLHVVKGLIKCIQMIRACVAADMRCHVQQLNVHLQRRVAQQTQKLRLGLDLCRHQIKYRNL